MAIINITELSKFYQKGLEEKGRKLLVCNTWDEFFNTISGQGATFALLP
jgi:hypothetical protein